MCVFLGTLLVVIPFLSDIVVAFKLYGVGVLLVRGFDKSIRHFAL